MAEENGLKSVNRGRISSGNPAANRRASIGSTSIQAGNSPLINSAEKSDSADSSKKKVIPHYLRASTGSCHDHCKYGGEHSFEKKERKPRKRIPKQQPFVEILLSEKQKMEKPSTSTHTKIPSPDLKPSNKPSSLDKGKEAMIMKKSKPSKDTKNHTPEIPSAKPRKENGSSGNKTVLSKKPIRRIEPPEIVKGVIFPSTAVEDSAKRAISTDKSLLKKPTNVSQPVRSKPIKVKPTAYSDNSDGLLQKGTRNGGSTMVKVKNSTASKAPVKKVPGQIKVPVKKVPGQIKLPVKKVLAAPVATLSPKLSVSKIGRTNSRKGGNLKVESSSVKDQNKLQTVVKTEESNDEKVSEKTLHVIETETKNEVSESTPVSESISTESLSSEDSSSFSSQEDDNIQTDQSSGEAEEVKQPSMKEIQVRTPRKNRAGVSEDKCHKLKFRSGKVMDVQLDSNSPRKLRFRRARSLGAQDSKGETRRALKKAGPKDETIDAEVSSEKVVLKHQDVQDKKDAQGLLNNVIEETASKLVETRKSKVKALVGAFETVISLQETKPSSSQVSC